MSVRPGGVREQAVQDSRTRRSTWRIAELTDQPGGVPARLLRPVPGHAGLEPEQLLGILRDALQAVRRQQVPGRRARQDGGVAVRRRVGAEAAGAGGAHPRTAFCREFLRLAKAVWLLHLLAFALDPAPAHFEASRGGFRNYMESVARFTGGRVPPGSVVSFPVGRASRSATVRWSVQVYLTPKQSLSDVMGDGTTADQSDPRKK
ncbi:hypothetical protein MUK42_23938 [Musa troglodytarum]|uniref:Uncharacterized protein n=1 Tax=Musa troglodytarum TaxID=320322 RepID=A0A9E7G6E3_9LILI|nr:hypothetical protein MUK42_23938 [Musa troglodytarum]